MAGEKKETQLLIPSEDPHNIQATKYYIFNETGNIMMASTEENSKDIEQSVRDVFAEVSVFFAAMTRAITTTTNPKTDEPYSIYNYTALEKILGGSGLFAWVTKEDIEHKTKSFGLTFSKELIEGLLGLATGAGALSFAQGMLSSIGQEGLKIGADTSDTDSSVANIVFVCEYLLGMPLVTVIVVYINVHDHKASLEIGPCFKAEEAESTWHMHKDTYLFVTPKFIKQFSSDLESVAESSEFGEFVEYLRSILLDKVRVTAVNNDDDTPVSGTLLTRGSTYKIVGTNLENTVSVKLGESDVLDMGEASDTLVKFTVKGDAPETDAAPIALIDAEDNVLGRTSGYGIGTSAAPTRPNVTGKKPAK
ncbi:MAG: hypothetical protein D8M58_20910 [Calditrichaeota bacterium]|nr:MAG: hypothetical protein DWQ03_16625 [Calditrichota bacterium]MBL1207872.1 hypothetical protein [Calditrichota bacterium]NOG47707.1 hypothetical protein [Calditrichota bacterium]